MRNVLIAVVCVVLISSVAFAQDVPKVEIFGGYSLMKLGGSDMDDSFSYWEGGMSEMQGLTVNTDDWLKKGFMASAAFNINEYFGIEGNFQYNSDTIMDFDYSEGTSEVTGTTDLSDFSFMAGPRFTIRKSEAVTPFAHFLLGVSRVKMTPDISTCELSGSTCLSMDIDDIYNELHIADFSDSGFAFMVGGGLDINASDAIAIRVIEVDYLKANQTVNVSDLDPEDASFDMGNLNLSFGVVFKIGQ